MADQARIRGKNEGLARPRHPIEAWWKLCSLFHRIHPVVKRDFFLHFGREQKLQEPPGQLARSRILLERAFDQGRSFDLHRLPFFEDDRLIPMRLVSMLLVIGLARRIAPDKRSLLAEKKPVSS